MAGHKVPNAIKFPTIRRVGIDSDLQEKMTHLQHKSCRDDILVAVYNRNGMSHASDDIVMVVKKNGLSKNSKIKTMSSLRDLVARLGMVSTNMSSRWDSCRANMFGL